MSILADMTLTELLSASLFLLTAILLGYAVSNRYMTAGQLCACGAILTVLGANGFFMLSYDGEPAVAYERPGPIKRAKAGERGVFEFEEEETTAQSGSGGRASGSDHAGMVSMASYRSNGPSRAERQIATGFDCTDCPDMVIVRPGVFRIGAAPTDAQARDNERPTRMIGIGLPFAIGRNEVTVGEYAVFAKAMKRKMPACPDRGDNGDPRLPVTCVSASDAEAYATWLAQRTGKPFRLPTEAEWEYAARAGTAEPYVTGETLAPDHANLAHEAGKVTRVGSYPANAFGLNDIHGNAAEVVAGCWVQSPSELPGDGRAATSLAGCQARVLRDAHAGEATTMARLSARRSIGYTARLPGVGFRLARDVK